jgi:large subunit ribosomal protein L22
MDKQDYISNAVARHVRISPQKCRLVTDLVRDRFVGEALTILQFSKKKKASTIVEKVLRSAVANAQQKSPDVDVDNLFIAEIFVNKGPQWKRFRAVPQGRAARILKPTSHVHIYLEERKGS